MGSTCGYRGGDGMGVTMAKSTKVDVTACNCVQLRGTHHASIPARCSHRHPPPSCRLVRRKESLLPKELHHTVVFGEVACFQVLRDEGPLACGVVRLVGLVEVARDQNQVESRWHRWSVVVEGLVFGGDEIASRAGLGYNPPLPN